MTSLFVDRRKVHLELEAGALVFRENGLRVGTVPLAPLSRVFLRGSVTLEAALLGKLGELGIGVVVLSGKYGRPSLLLSLPHKDACRRVEQVRHSLEPSFCLATAVRLLQCKLHEQCVWFEQLVGRYPKARYALTRAMRSLQELRLQLAEATSLESLRGLEGAAAHVYFDALREVVPPSLEFKQRNRRPPRDPFNALLSLTYTMLHAEAAMALHGAGLDPCVGFYHQLSWGRESLASDVLEPVRPLADAFCLHLCATQVLMKEHFGISAQGCVLSKAGRVRYYSAYEEHAKPLRQAIGMQVRDLLQALQLSGGPTDTEIVSARELMANVADADSDDETDADDS